LRVKLISAVLVLVAVALAVISFAGISFLSRYLLGQADDQLASLTGYRLQQTLLQNNQPGPQYGRGEAVVWVPDGGRPQQVMIPVAVTAIGRQASQQVIPGPSVPANPSSVPTNPESAITVGATSGDGRWRIVSVAGFQNNPDGTVTHGAFIVGLDVTSVYSTIRELTDIDLLVSLAIIVGLAIVGIGVVRASLRPLTDIEQTAEAIAAGDLTQRVPDRDPRTEVGRLGRSLNTMLAQIETAFEARAESEKAARRSEDRMRQFVADASHELRTPLTAIRGYAEYYRQRGGLGDAAPPPVARPPAAAPPAAANGSAATTDAATPGTATPGTASPGTATADSPLARADLDRIMQRVEQESSRMGVLVEDMLLLARLDQQRPLESHPVDMLTLAADAIHDARVVAPDRKIELTVGTGAALIVLGDEVRLRQVIGNLMSNALTHTPEGTPIEVRVRSGSMAERPGAAPGPPAGSELPAVIFEVTDHGSGLTPHQIERVFERFYRSDQARTRKAGGTGLGLAIVAALVAAHGGAVWVESPPGGGATFRIALPLAPEARHSEPEPEDLRKPRPAPADDAGSAR